MPENFVPDAAGPHDLDSVGHILDERTWLKFYSTFRPVRVFLLINDEWKAKANHRENIVVSAVQLLSRSNACDRTLVLKTSEHIMAFRFTNSSDLILFTVAFENSRRGDDENTAVQPEKDGLESVGK
ncbi:hypothetical protein B0H14DRAFT_2584620 [Mycena olivaceomarginata]|nr:hypothetical protein B0H14DRAFT_2584620 [Mycena olivaceomarginata]